MDIKSVLLGFLMKSPMTGYNLKKAFSMSFSFFSELSYGSIYPSLKKMEAKGWISKHVEIQDGAPNRKVYTITRAGKKAFIEALRSPFIPEQPKNAFCMKLFFFAHLTAEEREQIASTQLEAVKRLHDELELFHPEIKELADRFQYLCFQFGVRYYEHLADDIKMVIEAMKDQSKRR
jgi:DNA-binding PadR family transcriptional regulator